MDTPIRYSHLAVIIPLGFLLWITGCAIFHITTLQMQIHDNRVKYEVAGEYFNKGYNACKEDYSPKK